MIGVALAGCANHSLKEGDYLIKGTAQNMDGQTLYLYMYDEVETLDSTVVTNGAFQFAGHTDAAVVQAALVLDKFDRKDYRHYPSNLRNFYVEPTEMTVAIACADSLQNAVITGSQAEKDNQAYNDSLMGPMQFVNNLFYYELRPEQDPIKKDSLQKLYDTKMAELRALMADFKAKHVGSYVTFADSARMIPSQYSLEDMQKYYESFSPAMQKTELLREIKKEIDVLTSVAPGQPAPDFTTTDINGNEFILSSLKGHYVLVDFWASWCVPCRQSNPHILALMNKYKDKGFEVVGVADNDDSPDTWRKAVADDGTESFHHVLRGYGTFDISRLYAIHFLPTKYLIDPEGKIVGKMSDEEIDTALQEAYGF